MRNISTLEPTRYEIAAWHADGRRFLVCYNAGSVSWRNLIRCVQSRGEKLVAKCGMPSDVRMTKGTSNNRRPAVIIGNWMVGFTGRTQRDVRNEGTEHEFIGAA